MPEAGFWVDHPPYTDPEDLRYVTLRLRKGTANRFRTFHLPQAPPGNDEARLRALLDLCASLREDEERRKRGEPPLVKAAEVATQIGRKAKRVLDAWRDP